MSAIKSSEKFKQRINELIQEIHAPKKIQVSVDYLLGRTDEIKFVPAKIPSDFYTRYIYLRDLSHLTDHRVAADCKFDLTLCYKWKKTGHTPSLAHLDALCKYFEVSIDFLLGRTDDDTPYKIDPDWN